MSIEIQTRFDIDEVCEEFGIDPKAFLDLLQGKKSVVASKTVIFVLNEYQNNIVYQWKNRMITETTLRSYQNFIKRFLIFVHDKYPSLNLFDLNQRIFYAFLERAIPRKGENLSPRTINKYQAILRDVLEYAYTHKYISEDIRYRFGFLKADLLPRYLPQTLVEELLKDALSSRSPFFNYAVLVFLLGTGCRINELINIRICDVRLDEGVIFIREGKGKKERHIPLYPEVRQVIIDFLSRSGVRSWNHRNDDFLFCKRSINTREQVSARTIQYFIQKMLEKRAVKTIYTVHSFRHTFAVNCLKANMRIDILAQILGHNSIETTRVYTQLLPKDLKDEVMTKYPFPFEKLLQGLIGIGEVKE